MPATPILDPLSPALQQRIETREDIRRYVPQRFEFEMLHGILHFDAAAGVAAAFREIGADEFWVQGHIPGRPLFPGVLMIETAAQLCCYVFCRARGDSRFFAFGGVDAVRFRGVVTPGDRLVVMARARRMRQNLGIFDTQAFVDGRFVYEGVITGMILAADR
ncbi:MAG TPA: 3-hydroxyacyl-ACP dehydratase FabZ family protein [Candidatus Polarisedimenticolia bacterium]|nr:3-hydroxyacyl-ACP dehydratase FabZ family protein [Candidatus Polarisedimenticolia bacterium]